MEQNQFSAKSNGDNKDASVTSGSNLSYWLDSVGPIQFEPLRKDLTADVLVIGAGISGITTAYSLAKEGRHVVVVDDGFVGSGETGRTTAHVVNALDDFYHEIEKYHGEEGARYAAESHTAAIDFVERVVNEENIDCDFVRLNGYLFLHQTDKPKTIEDEYAATRKYGIPTELLNDVPGLAGESGPCMKYPNQAQFHPLKYLKCLTDAIIRMGSEVYTQSKASDIKEGSAKVNGHEVIAKHIVVATNTPVNDLVTMHTKQFPYRTYVVAFTIPKANREPSLWWDTGDHESEWITMPYNYVRLQEYNDEDYLLICGGADHKTGQADKESTPEEDRYPILEDWARKRFPDVKEVVYRWSGQVMEPIDTMGYIGRNPGDKNVYIVTGDSGNGMTHGTIAGILLPDLIAGRSNPWEKLYDPARITFRATPDYLIENSNTFKQYGDLIAAGDVSKLEEIPAGEGSVISSGLKKYAVYKDEAGGIHAYSAFCTHLGCVVHWNGEEKSFDCPCHGSRFSREGKVMNGPALSNLPEVEVGKVEK